MFESGEHHEIRPSMPLFLHGASYQEHLEVAQKLHEHSFFASGAFIEARLTSIPRALRYKMLFGPCSEEFTSYFCTFKGSSSKDSEEAWLLQAQGGTLFIDEIDALTADMQHEILKIISEKEERQEQGSLKNPPSFRIIFASQYTLSLLRDMKCLVPEFINWLVSLGGRQSLSAERVRAIKDVSLAAPKTSLYGLGRALEPILEDYVHAGLKTQSYDLYTTVIGEVERPLIKMALRYTGGNQLKTASLLGVNRNTLRKRIKELRIEIPSKGERM